MSNRGVDGDLFARPKPVPRQQRSDLAWARARPITTVVIAFDEHAEATRRFFAASDERTWMGTVSAETGDAAVLDSIVSIRTQCPELGRARFVPILARSSPLWRHRAEFNLLLPESFLEHPELSDQALVTLATDALKEGSTGELPADPGAHDTTPVTVATDGSVRGSVTGCGWLASSGAHGQWGFHHSKRVVGNCVVLISELRSMGAAVRRLPGRQLTLVCDSQPAIAMARDWMAGHEVLPRGYTTERANGEEAGLVVIRRLIRENRDRISLVWAPGHRGEPLNEGADALSRLASRYAAGGSGLTGDEYRHRAAGIAEAFATEYNRCRESCG